VSLVGTLSAVWMFLLGWEERRGEKWIRCTKCFERRHEECACRRTWRVDSDHLQWLSRQQEWFIWHLFKILAFSLPKLAITFACFQFKQFYFSRIMKSHWFSLLCIFAFSCYSFTLLQWNLFADAWKFRFVTSVTTNITSDALLWVDDIRVEE
jgi:hypothetical protein